MSIVTWNSNDYDYRREISDEEIWDEAALDPGPFDDGPDPSEAGFAEVLEFVEMLLRQGHLRYYRRRYDQALTVYRQAQTFLDQYLEVNPLDSHETEDRRWLRERVYIRVPMVLGDALSQKGAFMKASSAYLNSASFPGATPPITWGMIWTRAAEAVAEAGDRDYRAGDTTSAKQKYLMLFRQNSNLFKGALSGLFGQVEKILQNLEITDPALADTGDFEGHTPLMRAVVARVQVRLTQLENNEDYFGLSQGQIPITHFDRLKEVARMFAQTASRANREYVSFKASAEDHSFSVENLRRSAEVEQEGILVELANLESAAAEFHAAQEAVSSARERERLARAAYEDYDRRGWRIALLEELSAWASSAQSNSRTNLGVGSFTNLGLQGGFIKASHRIQEIAGKRARTSFYMRRDELNRQIRARAAEVRTTEAQRDAARTRKRAASMRVQAARARHAAAESSYLLMRNQETGARLYFELSEEAARGARIALDRAIQVAHLMQRAYGAEYGVTTDRIRGEYGGVDGAAGLFAGDILLRDIDYFDYHRTVMIKDKQQNATHSISLARDFPIEFRRLLHNGEAEFALSLDRLQARYPGIYNARVKKVLVEFDGYIAEHRPTGSLTSGSESSYRLFDPTSGGFDTRTRAHGSETQVLSDFRLAEDSFVQPPTPGQLAIFENIGLDTSWHLKLPLRLNDFERYPLYDVMIVVAFSCQHDGLLMAQDVADLPTYASAVVPFLLSDLTDPEESLPALANGDLVPFEIANIDIPRFYENPRIDRMQIFLQSYDLRGQLQLNVQRDGQGHGPVEVAEDGRAYLQDADETAHFAGNSPVGGWTLQLIGLPDPHPDPAWLKEVVLAVQITHAIPAGL
ncbi:hypothetical protein AB1K42_18070 [Roseibium algicola]|uniref:Tc toxin subunit A-related protein n=1 Tax=Roseibium algicola TaxID=2857014 RepID=UPI003457B237